MSGSDIIVRHAVTADLITIQRFNQALFQYEHDQGFYSGESFNLNWPYEAAGLKYFTDCLSGDWSSAVFIAEISGRPVGYLAATFATKAYRTQNPIGELENMFVDEAYRSQHVGSKLVDAFKVWAHDNNVVRIRVGAFVANSRAIGFYHRQGFSDSELTLEQTLS